jgi:hypothetical protein
LLDRDFGNEGKHFKPIFSEGKYNGNTHTELRFCRKDNTDCIEKLDQKIDEQTMQDIVTFEKTAEEIGEKTQFMVDEGDLLIFDNKRTLHSKTTASSNSDRLLKKIKLNIDRAKMYSISD